MFLFKKQFAIFVLIFIGFLTLSGYFINNDLLNDFVDNKATQWYDIIAGFAAFLGVLNLVRLHSNKISYKKKNWQYSILTLLGFFIMIFFAFIYNNVDVPFGVHLKNEGSSFYWMFNYIYTPLSSTMFALLAFFVASASYRAFRIRNFEATLLLISGALLMIGRVPIGALVPYWTVILVYVSLLFAMLAPFIKNKKIIFASFVSSFILITIIIKGLYGDYTPDFLYIPAIQQWILDVPSTAGHRAILMGIALGTVAQSFRIITGRETSILGD